VATSASSRPTSASRRRPEASSRRAWMASTDARCSPRRTCSLPLSVHVARLHVQSNDHGQALQTTRPLVQGLGECVGRSLGV
jgi:hypothetical protein